MNKKITFILIAFVFAIPLKGQVKYLHPYTDEVVIETHTYISKEGESLDFDIYLPANDPDTDRPLVLYVHGGGFQGGQRDNEQIVNFCNKLAGYGYAVASISYRLTRKDQPGGFGCNCPVAEKFKTFDAAVEDISDATFYLIQNHEHFGIDPYKIILAGSSAGAEAALIAAYTPPLCYDLEAGPVSYAGVIGMAGAIPDTTKIYDDSAIPSLFFHGTDDKLVPYATAPHHYCEKGQPGYLVLHGSFTLANKLEELGVPYWLHTTCGGGHEMASKPLTAYFDEIVDFCYNFVVNKKGESLRTIVRGKVQNPEYEPFNFCQ
ncbi:alpha/beta hydrolase [Mariniphaga sediminis]|uniref:Alpha/beta hydrolase n=1 Tax=Mariniphaga sediminis TaxID=1628158 RepID=A0A399D1C1_9BACT|nr:alpha/beta hydrolase [Mariniphaga sediminis]RIH64160.1 alpha/beta hydrolase [Mariniphaga sediminis]